MAVDVSAFFAFAAILAACLVGAAVLGWLTAQILLRAAHSRTDPSEPPLLR